MAGKRKTLTKSDDRAIMYLERIVGLLELISRPESKGRRILRLAGEIVTLITAIGIVDIIRNWITGD